MRLSNPIKSWSSDYINFTGNTMFYINHNLNTYPQIVKLIGYNGVYNSDQWISGNGYGFRIAHVDKNQLTVFVHSSQWANTFPFRVCLTACLDKEAEINFA